MFLFTGNDIGEEGGIEIGKALQINSSLANLELGGENLFNTQNFMHD